MLLDSDRAFVVFHFGGTWGALPLEGVEKITPMAELVQPPEMPAPLEGILNLGGSAVPVLRLDYLLHLPVSKPGLYSTLILAKHDSHRVALLVDRVSEILRVPQEAVRPMGSENSFNACVEATIRHGEQIIHVLSPARILLEKERDSLTAFLEREGSRVAAWGENASVTQSQPVTDQLTADPLYLALKGYLIEASGLSYYADKDEDLASRVQRRLSALGLSDCASYLGVLRDPVQGRAELDELIAEVTIGETYFFRHQEHFDALRDIILPDLIARNQDKRCLRIWCAGCADGPEAYSIAILLSRQMSHKLADWNVSILATDINRHSLARAREGKFGEWAFRATPDELKRDCFVKEGPLWRIAPQHKQWISFEYYNLIADPVTTPVTRIIPIDLIVCRNVMIYFDADVTRDMVQRFHSCLGDGGWLLVGPTEPNMRFFKSFVTVNAPGVTLYQKKASGNHAGNRMPMAVPEYASPAPLPPHPSPRRPKTLLSTPKPAPAMPPAKPAPPAAPTLAEVRLHADRGEWICAVDICERLLKADSLNWQTQFYYALVLDHLGRRDEAEAGLRKAIYLERQSAVPHYYLGLLLQSKGNGRQAARFFENAIQLLEFQADADSFAEADGITVAEMKKLAKMHLRAVQTT